MNLELVMNSYQHQLRTDRASQELRAYVRSEWRGDASWLRREASRKPPRSGLRAWFASRRAAATAHEPAGERPQSAAPAIRAEPVGLVEPCPHPAPEELGESGGVVFLRCGICGDVLVVEGTRTWSVDAEPSPTAEDLCPA